MSMQDKDIDQLFRSKLEGMQVEPSAKVWKGIVTELDGNHKKRALAPMLRIAAGIIIIMAIGFYFITKQTPVKSNQVALSKSTEKHQPVITKNGDNEEDTDKGFTPQAQQQVATTAYNKAPVEISKSTAHVKSITIAAKQNTDQNIIAKTTVKQPLSVNEIKGISQPVTSQALAVTNTAEYKPSKDVVPDVPLTSSKTVITDQPEGFNTAPKIAVNQPADELKDTETTRHKKRGIRSFGDLINVVVAKVDKREDKLIEFSNTDGDESTITGMNFGIVKVKREK